MPALAFYPTTKRMSRLALALYPKVVHDTSGGPARSRHVDISQLVATGDQPGFFTTEPQGTQISQRGGAATKRTTDHTDFNDFIRVISVIPAAAGKLW